MLTVEQRKQEMIQWLSSMLEDGQEKNLPEIDDNAVLYSGRGIHALEKMKRSKRWGGEIGPHNEGCYWIARMACNPMACYDAVIERIVKIYWLEERAGKARGVTATDFIISHLLRIYCLYKGKINVSDAMWQKVKEVFLAEDYATYFEPMSENHKLMHFANAAVAYSLFEEEIFSNGIDGKHNLVLVKRNLLRFANKKLKNGWCEFDSGYYRVDMSSLLNLYDFHPDKQIKKLAEMLMNALFAGFLTHEVNGFVAGPKSRVYFGLTQHAHSGIFWPKYVFTGVPENVKPDSHIDYSNAYFATTKFELAPALVKIASEPKEYPYEVKERELNYTLPEDDSIKASTKKYFYVTESYAMGAIVQREKNEHPAHDWMRGHQEQPWSLVFAENDEATIYSGHPGNPDGDTYGAHCEWTGDWMCNCGHYYQNKNVLIGSNIIKGENELKKMHFYMPKKAFDRIHEADKRIFLQLGDTTTVVTTSDPFRWGSGTNQEIELVVEGAETAFAVEVFEHCNIDEAVERTKNCVLMLSKNGVTYNSYEKNELKLDFDGGRYFNGESVDFSQYPLYGSKYIQSEYGSGKIVAMCAGEVCTIADCDSLTD